MKFMRLKNLGSPTSWDGSDYFSYKLSIMSDLPPALQSMTSEERYHPGDSLSFWNSSLSGAGFEGNELRLSFLSYSQERVFEFRYFGVKRVKSDYQDLRARPSMAIQELCLLRGVSLFRHAIASPFGKYLIVYCSSMDFGESRLS